MRSGYCGRVIEKFMWRRRRTSGAEVGRVKEVHAHLTVNALLHLNTCLPASLLLLYLEYGPWIWDASKVLHLLSPTATNPHTTWWVALISSCCRNGFHHQALHLFTQLQDRGVVGPTIFLLPTLLRACALVSLHLPGRAAHAFSLRRDFLSDAFVCTALIHMYSQCGRVHQSRLVFDMGAPCSTDVVALNAMVAAYAHHQLPAEGLGLVLHKLGQGGGGGCKPDVITWNSLLWGFSRVGNEAMTWEVLRWMCMSGVLPDVVSWTCVISGLVQSCRYVEAVGVLRMMMRGGRGGGTPPNSATLSAILPACAGSTDVKRGREIHGYAVSVGVEKDVYVSSALVDMYGKCGCIGEARRVFERMEKRSGASWNSMICAYSNHGYCDDAVCIFERMVEEDAEKVDHITITAVLTACCYGGRVEVGLQIFKKRQMYGGEIRMEQYACMVDLLGRAGKVGEAYDFIMAMPVQPDLFIWGAFLGACTRHGNIHLAEIALAHLSRLEPHSCAGRLLLKSLYADAGKWDKVSTLTNLIKKKPSFIHFPSRSWIEPSCGY